MPLFQPKFCGLTVRDFKCSLGWNQQGTQFSIALVQDSKMGDQPTPPPIGWPCYFQFYGLKYWGLLQKFEASNGTEGSALFDCTLVDPREILEGTQLIINDYNGTVGGVYNLINCYGYWENQGFGSSFANAAGMPWFKILGALNAICNNGPGIGAYGGALNFRGISYSLDLSQLPVPPNYYRVGGANTTLMDVITQLCEEAAMDYVITLDGYTIQVITYNRNLPQVPGTIQAIAAQAAASGGATNVQSGHECANDITSAFVVGAPQTELTICNSSASFWGYDLSGTAIIGTPFNHPDLGVCEQINLNATGVADIIGNTSYVTNTFELRFALHSHESWLAYIAKYKANTIGPLLPHIWGVPINVPVAMKPDFFNALPVAVANVQNEVMKANADRLYNWLKNYAESYYGKQFLVQIPFVLNKTDPETLEIGYSQEPIEAGWLNGGAASVGLSPQNLDVLQDEQERVYPFAFFPNIAGADTHRVNWGDTAIERGTAAYTRIRVSPRILFYPTRNGVPIPCVHVDLSSPIYEAAVDQFGKVDFVAITLVKPGDPLADKIKKVIEADKKGAFGTIGTLGVQPAAIYPTSFGIALKSNTELYGPWYVAGAPGKVRFESDSSLNPWDYGGIANMNLVGNSRVLSSITTQTQVESGAIHLVGAPTCNLGTAMMGGGPYVTNMEIAFGTSGVTTNYRFASHTQRFGMFSRQNADRMKRAAATSAQVRRDLRKALNRAIMSKTTIDNAFRGFKANRPLYAKKASPYDVILAEALTEEDNTRVGVSTDTYEASLVLSDPTGSGNTNRAVMSWNGLLRPFTTQDNGNTSLLPGYTAPMSGLTLPILRSNYDPFAVDNDLEIVTNQLAYSGMHAWRQGTDPTTTRGVALRGPLMLAGWGMGVDGSGYPDGTSGGYSDNYLKRSDQWKVGPVDLLWDNTRGVWTSHDLVTAQTPTHESIPPGGSAMCWVGSNSGWQLNVWNLFSSTVSSGTKIIAGWCLDKSAWYVIAADCTG